MRRSSALLALVVLLASAAGAGAAPRASVLGLENDLVCVTCHEPLNMSTSPLAEQMKRFIRAKVAAGWTTQQIENYFVRTLGPQVLAVPSTHGFDLLAWLIPLGGGALGVIAVGAGAFVWSRNRDGEPVGAPVPALGAALELRVDAELARFDAER